MSLCRAACAGAAVVAAGLLVGGPAKSQTPAPFSIVASDNVFKTDAGDPADVTILPGGRVDFAYPSGDSRHNVRFTGELPASCTSSAGPAATRSALPTAPSPAGWAGRCEFGTFGTYPFVCELHGSMTGSVTVIASSTAPLAPPPPPGTSPPGASPPPSGASPAPPGSSPPPSAPGTRAAAARGLKLADPQRRFGVTGSVLVTRSGSRLLARAFARRSALSGGRGRRLVLVGRRLRSPVGAGRVGFSVALNHAARRALRRHGRLTISLRLTVTPPDGKPFTASRGVVLRRPR